LYALTLQSIARHNTPPELARAVLTSNKAAGPKLHPSTAARSARILMPAREFAIAKSEMGW
jgi:hypothetical protein